MSSNPWNTRVETIKRHTRAACGCLAARLQASVRAYPTAYRLHARFVCDAKRRCSCSVWLVALYKCWAFTFSYRNSTFPKGR